MRLLARGEASSLYGAIVMSLILVIFASLYSSAMVNLSRQGEVYREVFRDLLDSSSESLDLYWNSSSGSIYAYSGSGSRVIYMVASNGSSIIMAVNISLNINPGSRVELLSKDLSQRIAGSQGFLAVFTERGRVYIYRAGEGVLSNTYALSVVSNLYYAVKVGFDSYTAYYYDQNGGRVNITTYRWDIDDSYIIFRSPINGTVYLEKISGSLSVLQTRNWFKPPSVDYQKPRITITLPSPWSVTKSYNLYFVFINTTSYTYNPSLGIIVARTITIAPSSATDSVSIQEYLSEGAVYTATWSISDMPSDWSVIVTINRLLPADLGIIGVGGIRCYNQVPYFAYIGVYSSWIAQSAIYENGPSYISISLKGQKIYIPTDDTCRITINNPSTPIHTWLYQLTAQGPLKSYTNTTVYTKQGNIITASNGNKIYTIDSLSLLTTT